MKNLLKKSVLALAAAGLACGALSVLLFMAPTTQAADPDVSELYGHKCAICHAKDGSGNTSKGKKVHVKDVHDNMKDSEAAMVEIVTKGKGKDMDGYGTELSKEQIKALVAYYRSLAK